MSEQAADVAGVRVPMLISGIVNTIAALAWFSTCVFAPLGIPFLVLAIFECIQFSKLGDPARHRRLVGSSRVIGICEVCTILTGNIVSLICGIFVLANLHKLEH